MDYRGRAWISTSHHRIRDCLEMLLNIMGYRGISWNRVEDHVIKVCLGRSLRILEYHGIPWNIVESRGISCNHGRTLRILEYLGAGSILPRGVSQHHPQTEEVATRSQIAISDPRAAGNVRGTYADFGRHGFGSIRGWNSSPYVPTMSLDNVPVYSTCTPTTPRPVCISTQYQMV